MDLIGNREVPCNIVKSVVIYMKKTVPLGKTKLRLALQLSFEQNEKLKISLLRLLDSDRTIDVLYSVCDLIAEITASFY